MKGTISARLRRQWKGAALGLVFAAALSAGVGQDGAAWRTERFPDADRPKTLKIDLAAGRLRVLGHDLETLLIRKIDGKGRPDVLVREANNEIRVAAPAAVGALGLEVRAPRGAHLRVMVKSGRGLSVRGMRGQIEATTMNAGMELVDVVGPVTAHALNGAVRAEFAQVSQTGPSSVSSLNGDIDLLLPADAKLNFRLKTLNGEMESDFPIRITGGLNTDVDRPLSATVNGGGVRFDVHTHNGDITLKKRKSTE